MDGSWLFVVVVVSLVVLMGKYEPLCEELGWVLYTPPPRAAQVLHVGIVAGGRDAGPFHSPAW